HPVRRGVGAEVAKHSRSNSEHHAVSLRCQFDLLQLARPCRVAAQFSERSSIHLIGRPSHLAAAATAISSPTHAPLLPKPPPTSSTMTRTSSSSRPRLLAIDSRAPYAASAGSSIVGGPSSRRASAPTRL